MVCFADLIVLEVYRDTFEVSVALLVQQKPYKTSKQLTSCSPGGSRQIPAAQRSWTQLQHLQSEIMHVLNVPFDALLAPFPGSRNIEFSNVAGAKIDGGLRFVHLLLSGADRSVLQVSISQLVWMRGSNVDKMLTSAVKHCFPEAQISIRRFFRPAK